MKKIISLALACVFLIGCLFTLASCSNISESYAEKINAAAKEGEHKTYAEVKEDLGENVVDITFLETGALIAVDGCKTLDDIKAKLDDGDAVKGIVVTVVAGKATAAAYRELTQDDLK